MQWMGFHETSSILHCFKNCFENSYKVVQNYFLCSTVRLMKLTLYTLGFPLPCRTKSCTKWFPLLYGTFVEVNPLHCRWVSFTLLYLPDFFPHLQNWFFCGVEMCYNSYTLASTSWYPLRCGAFEIGHPAHNIFHLWFGMFVVLSVHNLCSAIVFIK